jgi:hypothetical protein
MKVYTAMPMTMSEPMVKKVARTSWDLAVM